jgi:Laminin B (Domain IV)
MPLPHPASLIAAVALVIGAGASLRSQARVIIAHTFDETTHGWLVSGDSGAVPPQHHLAGGDPGGYVASADEALGETWYFRAPDDVLAKLAAAEGGTLTYSLKQSEPVVGVFEDDVVIVGPAGRLSYRFPYSPGTAWTSFAVRLDAAAGWRWNWNAAATPAQMRSVLANPTSLEIRGEYHTGPDEGALDSVQLSASR